MKNYQLIPMAYSKNVTVHQNYVKPEIDTLWIRTQVENPNEHTLSVLALMRSRDGSITDSCYFADDGNHNDDNSGDGIWGGFWPVSPGEKIYLALKISSDGNHYWSDTMPLHIVTNIANDDPPFPKTFALRPNYPNPFNPSTVINYQ